MLGGDVLTCRRLICRTQPSATKDHPLDVNILDARQKRAQNTMQPFIFTTNFLTALSLEDATFICLSSWQKP